MYNTIETVDGPNGTTITGTVTGMSYGTIWEVKDGNTTYERCPYSGDFYKK